LQWGHGVDTCSGQALAEDEITRPMTRAEGKRTAKRKQTSSSKEDTAAGKKHSQTGSRRRILKRDSKGEIQLLRGGGGDSGEGGTV